MRKCLGFALLLVGVSCSIASAQQRSYFTSKTQPPVAPAKKHKVTEADTLVEAPQTETIGGAKGTNPPGGDYGLGQPLCAPEITQAPQPTCTKGGNWWCNPCGFGGVGCGTPVRTFARNVHTQFVSLIPCGPWCRSRGCNCSGQSPYAMDWSKPDRRSRPCDCEGSHYLFPWIWGYQPSRKGCCNNEWTQRGDGYRSSLQFNQSEGPEMPYEHELEPVPSEVEPPQSSTASRKIHKVSHEPAVTKKQAVATVREAAPVQEDVATEPTTVRKPVPTGALSANYLTRMMPRKTEVTESAAVASPSKTTSTRRK